MKKNVTIVIIILFLVGISVFLITNNRKNENDKNNNKINTIDNKGENNMSNLDKKSLVLYFSATGTTEKIAQLIAEVTNSDITEIVAKDKYTSADLSYNNDCRANREQNDNSSRPEIENIINIEKYDTIYIGYPIWWGTNPRIILMLLDNYNFLEKDVALFCTSGSSDISQSVSELKKYNNQINIIGEKRFDSSTSRNEIEIWINNLNKR